MDPGGANGPALYATATTKDLYGRVKASVIKRGSPSDVTTTYTYDTAGDLRTITSPKGAVTSHTYDWAGNRIQTIDPDAGTSTAAYYPGGQVWNAKDGANKESWTTLDAIGRVTKVETGPSASKVLTVQNTYDTALKGTLASATRWDGADAFTEATTYDVRYRPASVTRSVPGSLLGGTGTQSWTTSMTYDQLDQPLTTSYPAAGGLAAETVTTSYTDKGYLYRVGSNLAGAPWYIGDTVHTNIGQIAYRLRGNWATTGSMQQSFWYDAATGRQTNTWARTPSGGSSDNLQNLQFTYANTGEVTSIADTVDGQRECYTYDGMSRLTLAGTTTTSASGCTPDMATGPNPYKETYAYDDDGNLTQLVRSTSPTAATTWNYTYGTTTLGATTLTGGPHALTVVKNATTPTNGYSYDAAGRQISKTNGSGTSPLASTWNSMGQLATVGGTSNAFTYGPDGSRWVRKTISGTTTTTTVYLPGQEVKRAVTGTTPTTSGVRYYTHGGETIATRSTSTALTWVITNYQGSNTTAVNASTGAATRDRYTPYGLNRATSSNTGYTLPGATGTDRGWLDRTRDEGTGLNYLGARYYDPVTAHSISPDPLNNHQTPQAANPYTYANDNPTTLSDPTGLAATQYWNRRVQPGDNWNYIADQYNVSLSQLRAWNGSLSALKVGQSIIVGIRSTGTSTTTPPAKTPTNAASRIGTQVANATSCNGKAGTLSCSTANRSVITGGAIAAQVAGKNLVAQKAAAAQKAKLQPKVAARGWTSRAGVAYENAIAKAGNLKSAANALKWVGRGLPILSGAVSAWSVYNDTESVWRAAGAGILNTGLAVLIGALSTAAVTAGAPVLVVAAVGVAAGVVFGNIINNRFSGRGWRPW